MSYDRSVHNIRIERLWVDLTAQFGDKWHQFFTDLEMHYGLNINNANHKWLLHYLFLSDINFDCQFFAAAWNQHKIRNPGQPARSPDEMWGFDMLVHGARGIPLDDSLTEGELQDFGVDWHALQDNEVIASQLANNPRSEPGSSWIRREGPPPNLAEVVVEAPAAPLSEQVCQQLLHAVGPYLEQYDHHSLVSRWTIALEFCRQHGDVF